VQPEKTLALGYTAFYGRDESVPFQEVRSVAVDSTFAEIIATDAARREVAAFDTNGIALGHFLHEVPAADGSTVVGKPAWVAVDRRGRILLSDFMVPWVDVLTVRGRSVDRLELPAPDDTAGAFGAGAIAVRRDGVIAVASRGDSGRVHVFGPDYRHVTTWGTPGTGAGELSGISGLAWTPDRRLVVVCSATETAVQIFDENGAFERGFGRHQHGPGNFSLPTGVAVMGDGRLWVGDGLRQIVNVYDGFGNYLGMVGGFGDGPGQFRFPEGLASDGTDLLVVAERGSHRVQVLRAR
jgi:sugar lactone lactonase YvrE